MSKFTIQDFKRLIKWFPRYEDPNKKSWLYKGKAYTSAELEEVYLKDSKNEK